MSTTIVFGVIFLIFLALLPFIIIKPMFMLDKIGMSKNSVYGFFLLVALISFILGVMTSPKSNIRSEVAGIQTSAPSPTFKASSSPKQILSLSPSPQASRSASPSATPATSSAKPSPKLSGDKDCKDFKTQSEAQEYFQSNGGSKTNNFNNLDYDHDGTACPQLP